MNLNGGLYVIIGTKKAGGGTLPSSRKHVKSEMMQNKFGRDDMVMDLLTQSATVVLLHAWRGRGQTR